MRKEAPTAEIEFQILEDDEIGEQQCEPAQQFFLIKLLRSEGRIVNNISTGVTNVNITDTDTTFPVVTATLTWDVGNGTPGDVDLDLIQLNRHVGLYGTGWIHQVIGGKRGTGFESGPLVLSPGASA